MNEAELALCILGLACVLAWTFMSICRLASAVDRLSAARRPPAPMWYCETYGPILTQPSPPEPKTIAELQEEIARAKKAHRPVKHLQEALAAVRTRDLQRR